MSLASFFTPGGFTAAWIVISFWVIVRVYSILRGRVEPGRIDVILILIGTAMTIFEVWFIIPLVFS